MHAPQSNVTSIRRPAAGVNIDPAKLTRLREDALLSRTELAGKTGISLPSLTKYENGERRPRMEALRKILDALNCDLNDLMI